MLRLLKKIGLFSIPFCLYFSLILIVDPYNYFNFYDIGKKDLKRKIATPLNYTLSKLLEFKNDPCPNIILGDSRADRLSPLIIKEKTGDTYTNLSYGGGTLPEIVSTFWWVNKQVNLKNVYIGINLNLYNTNNSRDRVQGTIPILENPLLYLTNRNVSLATLLLSKSILLKEYSDIEKPKIKVEKFWDHMLNVIAKRFYYKYKYPVGFKKKLEEIANYCQKKRINLIFFIPPTHVAMQKRIEDFGLLEARSRFLFDLSKLGNVYDFNYPNAFTQNRENFSDPNHFKHDKVGQIIKQMWGGETGYGRLFLKGSIKR